MSLTVRNSRQATFYRRTHDSPQEAEPCQIHNIARIRDSGHYRASYKAWDRDMIS